MEFGAELALARTERGLTQTELAGMMGIKQPNLARLEAGDQDPRLDTLRAMARALAADIVIKADGAVEVRLNE